jgi:Zn-dependent protease with chaperone function
MLVFAWVKYVRGILGNQLLVDELIVIFPVVLWLSMLWFITSPIKNKCSWVSYRLRMDVLLLLVPMFGLWGIHEVSEIYGNESFFEIIEFLAVVTLILLSPMYIRLILSAKAMKDTSLLRLVQEVGTRAGVQHPNVLVWNTHGRMMNAFAIGIIFQRKTIVLTDKLIHNLTQAELLSVVGHEFAHHKYWHLAFLGLAMLCALIWSDILFGLLHLSSSEYVHAVQFIVVCITFVAVSRKFERQADAYSVVDQSKVEGSCTVTKNASTSMSSSLRTLANSHNISIERNDPLHGSILDRQQYLESLVGCPIDTIPINRTVKLIKIGIVLLLVLGLAL